MIFAAGLGTRLRPLTNDRPKALVEVSGQPMLQRVILRLKAAGVAELVINIHHFGDRVIEFMRQNHDFGLTVHISDERPLCDKPLETGGGILQARQWLEDGEPFIVHNADILTDLDLRAFYRYHCDHGALATLHRRAFGGIHVISPAIFRLLDKFAAGQLAFGIVPFYLAACGKHSIYGYEPEESYTWFDIGKPETLKSASAYFAGTEK